jgi:hypothetical protein
MKMSGSHMSMSGMSMSSGGAGGTQILPSWLAVAWMLTFCAILLVHLRHAAEEEGERRLWHSGHVLMALGMLFMYAPSSIDRLDISTGFWRFAFGCAALAITALTLGRILARRAISPLWPLMAIDMAAMVYMWSSSDFSAPLTWVLVAYFLGQSLVWGRGWIRRLDEQASPMTIWSLAGGVAVAVAAPLICRRDVRISMCAMLLGMGYMLVAMQLAM